MLKEGYDFNIVDKTKELKVAVAFVGGQIPKINYSSKGYVDKSNAITWIEAEQLANNFKTN